MRNLNIIFGLLGCSLIAGAQVVHPQVSEDRIVEQGRQLEQAGKLFSVKMVPKDRVTSFFIVGKKAGQLKFDKLQVEATFFENLDPQRPRNIVLKKNADHFVYDGELQSGKLKLQIKTDDPTQSEQIEVKMSNP